MSVTFLRGRIVSLTGGVVWRERVHSVKSRGNLIALTFTGEDDLAFVVDTTVGVDDLRVRRVDGRNLDLILTQSSLSQSFSLLERNLLDDGRFVKTSARSRSSSVLNEEDLFGGRIPDNSLVKDGIAFRRGDKSQSRILADDIEELIIVDVEGLLFERLLCHTGPCEDLAILVWGIDVGGEGSYQ